MRKIAEKNNNSWLLIWKILEIIRRAVVYWRRQNIRFSKKCFIFEDGSFFTTSKMTSTRINRDMMLNYGNLLLSSGWIVSNIFLYGIISQY